MLLSGITLYDSAVTGTSWNVGEIELGRLVDALAPGGDEGRDKLR